MDYENLLEKVTFFKTIAERFNYVIHSVATVAEIEFFEEKFNVRLPEDFRWFMLNVANGITNCRYQSMLSHTDFTNFFHKVDEYNPALPFPFTQRVYFGRKEDDDAYEDPGPTEYGRKLLYSKNRTNGQINLFDDFLVINGPEYGNIWIDNISSNREMMPNEDKEAGLTRINFEHYITYQLDLAIQAYQPRSRRYFSLERQKIRRNV
jgi:hypothetical protein